MTPIDLDVTAVALSLGHVVLGVLSLVFAKLLKDWLSPYNTEQELTEKDNPAFGLALAGYYGAVVLIYLGAVRASGPIDADAGSADALMAYGRDLLWTLAGIGALAFSRWLMNLALMGSMRCSDEIVRARNVAAGAVECGVYVASGVVIAGVLREPGSSPLTFAVFFVLSQVVLLLFGRLYARLAGYDVVGQIGQGNLAAGVPMGLTLVAFALLISKATSGEFVDWQTNLGYFAFDTVVGIVLLMSLRWLTDLALLPNARIADEVVRDRNVNAGLIEGVAAVGVAALILVVF